MISVNYVQVPVVSKSMHPIKYTTYYYMLMSNARLPIILPTDSSE